MFFPQPPVAPGGEVAMGNKEIWLKDLQGLPERVRLLEVQMKRVLEEAPKSNLEWEELSSEPPRTEKRPQTLH